MMQWFKNFRDANPQIKYFALTWFIFGLALFLSTLFVYGRLDFVRSDQALQQNTTITPQEL